MSEFKKYTDVNPSGYQYTEDPLNNNPFWEGGESPAPCVPYVVECKAESTTVTSGTQWDFSYTDSDGKTYTYASVVVGSGGGGGTGENGATFTPKLTTISGGYRLSWTNDKGLKNPDPVDILNGAKGDKGDTGATGPQGPKGETGATGATGETGPEGPKGETGEAGADGVTFTPSAGITADGRRFISWSNDGGRANPSTLYWSDGAKGDKGDAGETGTTFTPAIEGITSGSKTGYRMTWTNDGGKDNPDPVEWFNGSGGGGGTGEDGTTFTPTVTADTSVTPNAFTMTWTNDGGKTNPDPVTWYNGAKGDKGDKGDTGAQGPTGPQGEKGSQGVQGPQGEKGEKGDTGPQGPTGATGATGETGPQGPQGIQGEKGEKGDTGATGPEGPQGPTGPTGAQGNDGATGTTFTPTVTADTSVTPNAFTMTWTNDGGKTNPDPVTWYNGKDGSGGSGGSGSHVFLAKTSSSSLPTATANKAGFYLLNFTFTLTLEDGSESTVYKSAYGVGYTNAKGQVYSFTGLFSYANDVQIQAFSFDSVLVYSPTSFNFFTPRDDIASATVVFTSITELVMWNYTTG